MQACNGPLIFENGLIGFNRELNFVLEGCHQEGEPSLDAFGAATRRFLWMVELGKEPMPNRLRFLVTDPARFVKGFAVTIDVGLIAELRLKSASAAKVLVICSSHDGWITGNLAGPLLIDPESGRARQIVLSNGKWSTRERLISAVAQPAELEER
jgi:flagellar assembly factor FliW